MKPMRDALKAKLWSYIHIGKKLEESLNKNTKWGGCVSRPGMTGSRLHISAKKLIIHINQILGYNWLQLGAPPHQMPRNQYVIKRDIMFIFPFLLKYSNFKWQFVLFLLTFCLCLLTIKHFVIGLFFCRPNKPLGNIKIFHKKNLNCQ